MKPALRTYTPPYEYYSWVGISRRISKGISKARLAGLFPNDKRPHLRDPREEQLRRGVRLLGQRRTEDAGKGLLAAVAQDEATKLMKEFRLEAEHGAEKIIDRWLEDGRGVANLVEGAQTLGPVESRNVLLARLKTFLRSRAVDVWRALYAERNPVAQFVWVRMGKVLKDPSSALEERRGLVGFKEHPLAGPGAQERVSIYEIEARPTAPRAREPRDDDDRPRLRLPPDANADFEGWMVGCLTQARGKLKRRTMAELLARVHGHEPRYPGQRRDEANRMDAEMLSALEDRAEPEDGEL